MKPLTLCFPAGPQQRRRSHPLEPSAFLRPTSRPVAVKSWTEVVPSLTPPSFANRWFCRGLLAFGRARPNRALSFKSPQNQNKTNVCSVQCTRETPQFQSVTSLLLGLGPPRHHARTNTEESEKSGCGLTLMENGRQLIDAARRRCEFHQVFLYVYSL